MKKILILIIIVQYLFSSSCAQNIDILWNKSFLGSEANSLQNTLDDGFIITGNIYYNKDILKLNSIGDSMWTSIGCHCQLYDMIPIGEYGYIATGGDFDDDKGIIILIINDNGNIVWKKNYQKTGCDFAFSIIQNNSNGFLVGGTSWRTTGGGDYWILNIDEYGDTLWTKTYGSFSHDVLYSIGKTSDDKYIIAGSKGYDTLWVLKLDEYGDSLWTREYKGSVKEIIETSDGGFILTGQLNNNILISKLDNNGFVEWSKDFGENGYIGWGNSIIQTPDEGYLITGTNGFYTGDCESCYYGNLFLAKLDFNGNILWLEELEDYFEGKKILKTLNKEYVVLGIDGYLTKSLEVFKFKEKLTSNNHLVLNSNFLLVFPNPAKDYIRIKNNSITNDETNIIIYNISGKKVLSKTIGRNQNFDITINLTEFIKGIYILKIESNDMNIIEKIILE